MTFPSQATFGLTSQQGAGVRGAAGEVLRRMLETMVQEAIERKFERFLGAGPWERTELRRGLRNGKKRRTLKTRVGALELRVPKDREGRFQPSHFERYQRSENALTFALLHGALLEERALEEQLQDARSRAEGCAPGHLGRTGAQ